MCIIQAMLHSTWFFVLIEQKIMAEVNKERTLLYPPVLSHDNYIDKLFYFNSFDKYMLWSRICAH